MNDSTQERRLRRLAEAHGEFVRKCGSERGFEWGHERVTFLILDRSSNIPVAGGNCATQLLQRYIGDDSDA